MSFEKKSQELPRETIIADLVKLLNRWSTANIAKDWDAGDRIGTKFYILWQKFLNDLRNNGIGNYSVEDIEILKASLYECGRQDALLLLFRTILELKPGDPTNHINLGLVYRNMGQRRRALKYYNQGIELQETMMVKELETGLEEIRNGDFSDDLRAEQIKEIVDYANYLELRADILYSLNKKEESLSEVKKAVKILEQIGSISSRDYYLLANMEESLNHPREAVFNYHRTVFRARAEGADQSFINDLLIKIRDLEKKE